MAQFADEKSPVTYIESGATHHFFYHRAVFTIYSIISEEPIKAAAGVPMIVGKGHVRLPIGNGILVEA